MYQTQVGTVSSSDCYHLPSRPRFHRPTVPLFLEIAFLSLITGRCIYAETCFRSCTVAISFHWPRGSHPYEEMRGPAIPSQSRSR